MRTIPPFLALALLCTISSAQTNAQQDEEGPDIRGVWSADVIPSTKELGITDCPCESYTQMIEISCKPASGVARVELNDFITEKARAGDKITVTYDVDGKTLQRDAVMAAFSGQEVRPGFNADVKDELFAAISAGRNLKMTHAGRSVISPLKGSKKAMQKMMDYCGK
jgi:hypothetical protein